MVQLAFLNAGGVEGDRVWMTCSSGAVLVRVPAFS
jgi:hypothetical protein